MTARFAPPKMSLAYGTVAEVGDPDGGFRVKIALHGYAGTDGQDYAIWARVAQPVAGSGYGTVLMPDVGDEVIVGFVAGDMTRPVVLGALYTGQATPAHEPVDSGGVKRWAISGHQGTEVVLEEASSSTVTITTAGGVSATLTDEGRSITCEAGGSTITIGPDGITLQTGATVTIQASTVDVSASMVNVNAGMSKFSGVVSCDVLQTNTVISTTYTPGAGNIW